MSYKLVCLALIALLVVIPAIASAETITISNATTQRDITDVAYPDTLFYLFFAFGFVMLLFNVIFIVKEQIPASPMAVCGVLGFCSFMISAYIAPMAAKSVWIVAGTEAKYVTSYIFSPWVMYICFGLSMINLMFFGFGVIRYFQLLAANQKRLNNPEHQFEMYMRGED